MPKRVEEPEVQFFETPAEFRRWLQENHASRTELWVGYRKRATGLPSLTWPESVDEALAFGWIDGLRKSLGEAAYKIRFTPRRASSIWSAVNVARVGALVAAGRMTEAGLAAFARRSEARTGVYGHDREKPAELPPGWEARFRKEKRAWAWFTARAPSYQRTAVHWVMSAKKEETRLRRFETLLSDSKARRTVRPLTPPSAKR